MRLLYVEDNALVRELTCELLAADGRQIVACASAEEAFGQFNRGAVDVVITDMNLPAQSGLELAKRILAISPDASIVIVSGYALPLPLAELGPNVRSLIKPIEARQIDALIDELLRGSAPRPGRPPNDSDSR
jgi:CheY-like chemotaxis protein